MLKKLLRALGLQPIAVQPTACTRDVLHDGPCNGLPHERLKGEARLALLRARVTDVLSFATYGEALYVLSDLATGLTKPHITSLEDLNTGIEAIQGIAAMTTRENFLFLLAAALDGYVHQTVPVSPSVDVTPTGGV